MEVNPFHNGHKYFLDNIVKEADDILIVIISASITQRGEFVCLDKKVRTELLLKHNVDVVLELPSSLACQGGFYFAKHSINILKHFKITDLYFGSETDDITKLQSYVPSSNDFKNGIYKNELTNYLSNEILGISYLRNIDSSITPHIIKRVSNNYNDTSLNKTNIQSATAIRNNLNDEGIKDYTPNGVIENINLVNNNDILNLFVNSINKVTNPLIIDPNFELYNKITKILKSQNVYSLNELITLASDKNNSKNKINRYIMNVIFNIEKEDYEYYYRVLGFNNEGIKYLKQFDFITDLKNSDNTLVNKEIEITKLFKYLTKNTNNLDFSKPVITFKK